MDRTYERTVREASRWERFVAREAREQARELRARLAETIDASRRDRMGYDQPESDRRR